MEVPMKEIVIIFGLIGIYNAESATQTGEYGESANIKDYPYFAYLTDGYTKNFKCGGAIIHTNLILTAAHCLENKHFRVYVGVSNSSDLEDLKPYSVSQIFKHPGFVDEPWDDIGLVKLTDELALGPKVNTIGLATVDPSTNNNAEIIGFGKVDCTDNPSNPSSYSCGNANNDHLRSALVNIAGIGNKVIYTVGRSFNTCPGDSGGPMIYDDEVVGIVSGGSYNGCSTHNIQVSVPTKYEWIERHMENAF